MMQVWQVFLSNFSSYSNMAMSKVFFVTMGLSIALLDIA